MTKTVMTKGLEEHFHILEQGHNGGKIQYCEETILKEDFNCLLALIEANDDRVKMIYLNQVGIDDDMAQRLAQAMEHSLEEPKHLTHLNLDNLKPLSHPPSDTNSSESGIFRNSISNVNPFCYIVSSAKWYHLKELSILNNPVYPFSERMLASAMAKHPNLSFCVPNDLMQPRNRSASPNFFNLSPKCALSTDTDESPECQVMNSQNKSL